MFFGVLEVVRCLDPLGGISFGLAVETEEPKRGRLEIYKKDEYSA